jgi:hypothetical protein
MLAWAEHISLGRDTAGPKRIEWCFWTAAEAYHGSVFNPVLVLRAASVLVGVGVGLLMAYPTVPSCAASAAGGPSTYPIFCVLHPFEPRFALWLCAVAGAAAAAVVLLASFAVRPPSKGNRRLPGRLFLKGH